MKAKQKRRGDVGLTEAQLEIVGQFNDYSFENPNNELRRSCQKGNWAKTVSTDSAGKAI
jgi:hypothetical protein